MPQTLEGGLDAGDLRVAIVVSRFNDFVTGKLLAGAEACLERHGCSAERRVVVRVPGAWELPLAARKLIECDRADAVIALGALIRGDTPHFEYIAGQTAAGLASLAADRGVPVAFGVLTTENAEQATDRAGGKHGNKGWEAALAALEMANLYRMLDGTR